MCACVHVCLCVHFCLIGLVVLPSGGEMNSDSMEEQSKRHKNLTPIKINSIVNNIVIENNSRYLFLKIAPEV